jgi:hypothetical protein
MEPLQRAIFSGDPLGMLAGAPLDDISRLKDLLDYRTAVAFLAIQLFAIATLFVLLLRAMSKHLATAVRVVPLAEKMTETVATNTRVIERLASELHDAGRVRAPQSGSTEAA